VLELYNKGVDLEEAATVGERGLLMSPKGYQLLPKLTLQPPHAGALSVLESSRFWYKLVDRSPQLWNT